MAKKTIIQLQEQVRAIINGRNGLLRTFNAEKIKRALDIETSVLVDVIDSMEDIGADAFDWDRPIKALPNVSDNLGASFTTVAAGLEELYFPFIPSALTLNGFSLVEEGTQQTPTVAGTFAQNDETTTTTSRMLVNTVPGATSPDPIPFGAISQLQSAITADTTYKIEADVDNNGTPNTISSNTVTVDFIFPFFYGSDADASLTGNALYLALTKLIQNQGNKTVNLSPSTEYIYFCYPDTYPDLTSILDPNSFEVLGSFTKFARSVTSNGLFNDYTQGYKVYRSNGLTSAGGNYQFKF